MGVEMNDILWKEFKKAYGEQCEKYRDEIEGRVRVMLTALMYAGDVGDNPLCELNRAFQKFD